MGLLSGYLVYILVSLIVLVGLFLLLREVFCWYWKINQGLSLLEEQNELLRRMVNGGNMHSKAPARSPSYEQSNDQSWDQPRAQKWTSQNDQQTDQSEERMVDQSDSLTKKPQKGPFVYVAPPLKTQNTTIEESTLGGTCECIELEFADGVAGCVYYRQSEDEYYFRNKSDYNATCYFYDNFSNCVNAFHSYQTTGKILKVGYEGSLS